MHRLSKKILTLITLCCLMVTTRWALGTGGPVFINLTPELAVKQGGILMVDVKDTQAAGGQVVLGKLHAPLFLQSNHDYTAVLGIPVDDLPELQTLKLLSAKGEILATKAITVADGHYAHQNITVSKSTNELKPIPGELDAVQHLKEAMTPIRYWQKPFISPTPDCENSVFGVKRYHNGVYIHDYHKGVDLRSPAGRPIKAINDGIVEIATTKFRLHGGTVGIDHGQGISSIYIHMSKVLVQPGQHVHQGDVIGLVGSTGFATGPHIHWGFYANGVPVNPDLWIPVKHCS